MTPDDPVRLLRESALFGDLLDEDYDLLRPGLKRRSFAKEATLFLEGDEGGSAFLIVEGCVSIERLVDSARGDSETVQLAVRGPGEFIGELSLFDDAPRNADARALEPTTALHLRGGHILRCAEQSPEMALAIMRALARKLREATDRRIQARTTNVRARLRRALEEEARLHGVEEAAGTRIPLATPDRKLTQTDLGVRAGCDRAVVNRTLAELVADGLVEKDRVSILLRRVPRRQAVAGTLLRAAREGVLDRFLRVAPKPLGLTPEGLVAEVDRLAALGALTRDGDRITILDASRVE